MKRTYLFFVLVSTSLTVAIMAGPRCEDVTESKGPRPYQDFVSCCRAANLTERRSVYRAKIDNLVEFRKEYLKGSAVEELIREIARQGDFESLELLEKDLPPTLKMYVWQSVVDNNHTKDANALLVKWAKENPRVPLLMEYLPNGVDLLIKTAEDKNASFDNRVTCLYFLGAMPGATKVLDRVRALISDKTTPEILDLINVLGGVIPDIEHQETLGSVAAETVKKLEALIQKQRK
jgi:hypothetical protein